MGAGLLDLACPVPAFEPLRLATRYAAQTQIVRGDDSVTMTWAQLGANRAIPLSGAVSAMVRMKAAPDGRSLILSCEVRNDSDRPLRQVLFPDLNGLLPTAGVDRTILKTGGFGSAPFRELRLSESDEFYAQTNAYREHTSGGMFSDMWLRWFDLGGLTGGFSLFPRLWGWEARSSLLLHLSPVTQKLRLMCAHGVTIAPGEAWTSEEWVLTPHRGGWAKGIEPYRQWARQRMQRVAPVPEHVRRGLGFRSLWLCQNQPDDPAGDAIWRFRDLPALAREAKEHGLDEMVLWSTQPEPIIQTLTTQVRAYSRARDPQSTFSGEELWNVEVDCDYLDYTWNWGGYRDCQAYTNVFPAPRRNLNINRSVREVKRGFLDGLYLNVWPTKPGGVNGSDRIDANADLSRALKQCARLRDRFADYIADGVFIGGCILAEENLGVHATARVLPDRVLMLFTNEGTEADVTLKLDLSPWLPSGSGRYAVHLYDAEANPAGTAQVAAGAQPFTATAMKALETRAAEFLPEP